MKQAKVLTDAELKRVLAVCSGMPNGKRNRIMLLLSHYAGMRVGEISSLKWADVLDREMKPKAMFYLKAENTKANWRFSNCANTVIGYLGCFSDLRCNAEVRQATVFT